MKTLIGAAVVVVVVVSGSQANAGMGFPPMIALAGLDGANGFQIDPSAAGENLGRSISAAGDINGDGIMDMIIGAPGASPGGRTGAGSVFVVFGRDPNGPGGAIPPVFALTALDGSNGFRINGVLQGDGTGISVACAGDVNGDGMDDVIMGASFADPNSLSLAGSAFVVFGRDTSGPGGPFPAALELSALDGSNGFRLNGGFIIEMTGTDVASAGDVNADGVGDIIIGADSASVGGSNGGRAYVVFGRDTASAGLFPAVVALPLVDGTNGMILNAAATTEQCGHSVACAGDVNHDGADDLIIGAPGADPNLIGDAGSTYIVYGRDTSVPGNAFPAFFPMGSLNGMNGFRVNGVEEIAGSGFCAVAAGDINGDGVDDFAIGAPQAAPGAVTTAGSVFVIFGRAAGGPTGPFPALLSLASIDGSNGFRLNGVTTFDQLGNAIAPAGDINGDSMNDLVVGAPGDISTATGRAFVLFGRGAGGPLGPFPATMSVADLNGANGFQIIGAGVGHQAGISVCAGDINGDGVDDALVGAYRSGGSGGRAYVVYGRGGVPCPGDTNGDGEVNFADLNNVLADFNTTGANLPGDTDDDGDVDFADLNTVVSAFNTVCP